MRRTGSRRRISQYSRNPETGALSALSPASVEAGYSPEGCVVSPDGKDVYVANRYSNTVSEYSRNTTTGALDGALPSERRLRRRTDRPERSAPTARASTPPTPPRRPSPSTRATPQRAYSRRSPPPPSQRERTPTASSSAPTAKSVYATNYNSGTVSQYSRNSETGKLTALSPATVAAGTNPHDLAISPDGKSIYIANSASPGKVTLFTRNTTTGALTATPRRSQPANTPNASS